MKIQIWKYKNLMFYVTKQCSLPFYKIGFPFTKVGESMRLYCRFLIFSMHKCLISND